MGLLPTGTLVRCNTIENWKWIIGKVAMVITVVEEHTFGIDHRTVLRTDNDAIPRTCD